uniref:DNA-directed RNA polymerase subunit alpha n=2 Tax=Ophioglossum TaxID=13833 RepID=L7SZK6_9MONI|nr:DNA-directed RNA polymerase subunit alpha [Ophioglossum californicum]AGC26743.1 DNA-directed RNA polymerase subunit alpha [Ophioglossum californicum]QXF60116.1 RNA polymerase alpha subunit [Ophioglossum vulgatum]
MVHDETPVPARILQWRCIESKVGGKRLHYGRFAASPFGKGQAGTVGIALRRALLGEVEGASITYAKSKGVIHEYSTLVGIRESIHDILINSREIVSRSDSYETQTAFIHFTGPGDVTAGDISIPSTVHTIDASQHIATVTKTIPLDIELRIEKDRGYRIRDSRESQNGEFFIDAVFTPVRNASYSVHSFGSGNRIREILFIEVWTNGGLTPEEALCEASRNLIDLFIPFSRVEGKDLFDETNVRNGSDRGYSPSRPASTDTDAMAKELTFRQTSIDQLELPARAYNCLRKMNIHTISDILNYSQEDLKRIKNFGNRSVEQVVKALEEHFAIRLPR